MRKLIYIIGSIFVAALFVRCTLMMDDLTIPEEEQGIEEPYTTETPFGDVTYQYNDNVTPLNGTVQDYIAAIEHDTIIYLLDNIPSKWMPKVGGYIAANCSRVTPTGLNHLVLAIENVGGMYKLTTTPAERDEVYKVLKVNIDFDYDVPAMEVYDSLELDSMGISLDDSTVIDMSLFDLMDDPEALEARTRGEDAKGGDKAKDTTITFEYNKSWKNWSISYTYKTIEHKKFHVHEDSEAKIKEDWTDSHSEVSHSITVSYGTDASKQKFGNSICASPGEWKKICASMWKDFRNKDCPWKEKSKKLLTKDLKIPIPTTPFTILLDFEGKVYIDARVYGTFTASRTTKTERQGKRIVDGKLEKIEKTFENTGSDWQFNFLLGGSAEIYGQLRAGIGVLLGKSVAGAGGVVGIQLKAGLKIGAESEFLFTNDEIDRENVFFEPYVKIGGYASGVVVFLGKKFELGSVEFATHTFSKKYTFSPQVDESRLTKAYSIIEYQPDDETPITKTMKFKIDMGFKKLSTFNIYPYSKNTIHPAIRIYWGEMSDNKFVTIDHPELLAANKTYHYDVIAAKEGIPDAMEYHIVPCIHKVTEKSVCEYRNHILTIGSGIPKISQPKVTQWYGVELDQEKAELYDSYVGGDGVRRGYFGYSYQDYAEYAFTTTTEIKYARTITEWGFICKIYNKDDKLLFDRNIKFDYGDGIWASGKYTLITTFIANWKPEKSYDGLYVTMQPYWKYKDPGGEIAEIAGIKSKALVLNYNYERKGGPYTSGKVTSVNLNME